MEYVPIHDDDMDLPVAKSFSFTKRKGCSHEIKMRETFFDLVCMNF